MFRAISSHPRHLRVGVVLPAHNESRHLADVVAGLPVWVDRIVIVDDASTDATLAVAQGLEDSRVRVIRHEENAGVGGATRSGYRAALDEKCDVVVKMDADGQMDVRDLSAVPYALAWRTTSKATASGVPGARGACPLIAGLGM